MEHTHRRWMLGATLLLALVTSASAGSIQLFTGERLEGRLELGAGLTIAPAGGSPLRIDLANLLRATFTDTTSADVPPGVVLRNGIRIAGPIGSLAESPVKILKRNLTVPGAEIAWVVYSPFAPALAATVPAGKLGALLAGGDFFEGSVKGADGETARLLNPIFGPRTFGGKDILALILREVKPATAEWEVRATDGSIFLATSLVVDKAGLMLRHPLYDGLVLAPQEIAEIRAGPGRYVALAGLKPAKIEVPPGRGVAEAAFAVDRRISGEAFGEAGSRGMESAVGVAAVWALTGEYTVLSVQVSVPPEVPPVNKLIFAIYADGKLITRTSQLTSQDRPQTLRAQLGAARVLALRIEAGFPTNAVGTGLWIEPTLLRR